MDNIQDISVSLLTIYNNNLHFLKESHYDLYTQIDKFSKDIESGQKKEKYTLELYNGYFDILNVEENSLFYNVNSYNDADFRAEVSNFTKDGSLDLLRKNFDGKTLLGSNSFKDLMPIIEYLNKHINFDEITFHKIYKFIFIGTGLGIHIHEINKKLNPMNILIIEPDLEIFRLSLFITDYSEFAKGNKKLFFSVGETNLDRLETLGNFYKYHSYMNYNIKHHLLLENYTYLKDEIVSFFSTNTVTSFPYALTLENIDRTLKIIKEKNRFLDANLVWEKNILLNQNVLVIAAGPSLDNYIDWIAENQNKFFIICVDVIVRKLEKHKIIPKIVVSIDPSPRCGEYLTCDNMNYLKDSAIIFLAQQHPSVLNIVKGKHTYFSQSIQIVHTLGYLGSVSNVGAFAFALSVHLGAKTIYTIGNDAAFNQENGSRYALDSSHSMIDTSIDILNTNEDNFVSNFDHVFVKGNLRDTVKTNRALLTFKESFESTLHSLESHFKDLEIFNLSDGVKLEGFTPMRYEDIKLKVPGFSSSQVDIINLMDNISTVLDMPNFKNDLRIINSLIIELKNHCKKKLSTKDEFLKEKLDMMILFLNESKKLESYLIANMFLLYTELADIYINFFINLVQKDLNKQKHYEKLNDLWSNGLIKLLKNIKKIISQQTKHV